MPHLQLMRPERKEQRYYRRWNQQPHRFFADESAKSLTVVTPWHKISRNHKKQPHKERRVGAEKMPNPRHIFCAVGRSVSPSAAIAVCNAAVVEDNKHRECNFQIVKVIETRFCVHGFKFVCKDKGRNFMVLCEVLK